MADKILPGTIMAYAGSSSSLNNLEPNGWLLCDGKLYDRTNTKYANLFGAIGTGCGGDGANMFAVPDLRGIFLRGVSDTSGNDPDATLRVNPRSDLHNPGNGGNAVGSKQLDDTKPHEHLISDPGHAHVIRLHTTSGDGGIGWSGYDPGAFKDDHGTAPAKTGITKTELNDGKETRPKNAYVYYIIKL